MNASLFSTMFKLEIAPVTDEGLLPICTPSLMPFHISYTGHAPVSLYLRPRPVPPPLAALSAQSSSTATLVASSSTSVLSETKSSLTAFSSTTSVESLVQESECGEHVPLPRTGSFTTATSQVEMTPARPVVDTDTTMETDPETQPALGAVPFDNSSRLGSRNVSRFVAAFRGRQMYGQAVDIPDGYGGLVLRAPFDPKGKGTEDAIASSKPVPQKAKLRSKAPLTTRRSKRGMANDTADGPGGGDDEDCSPDSDVDPSLVTKKLIPCSTFTSFMLWAQDRPLDEGRDEYVRALAEWTRLAAEIHSYDE